VIDMVKQIDGVIHQNKHNGYIIHQNHYLIPNNIPHCGYIQYVDNMRYY